MKPERDSGRAGEFPGMSRDLSTLLRRRAHSSAATSCSCCQRVPLAGELMHELEKSHRVVCQLCLSRLPAKKRATIGAARVHVSERPLAVVVPRAA
jgi:hypothetical protein